MLEQIDITKHALERYEERLKRIGNDVPAKLTDSLIELMSHAEPEKMDEVTRVTRIINNNCNPADYYVYEGWRFVVANAALVTVERVNKDEN